MAVNKNYFINEGNRIGGQEPQALGTTQNLITADGAITKGMLLESTGNWTVGPAGADSIKVVGIAANDAADGELVVIETEGFVKLSASNAAVAAGDKIVSAGNGLVKKLASLEIADVDLGAAYAQEASNAAVNTAVAAINSALAGLAGVCGVVIAGCDANGNPYIKLK